MYGAIKPIQDVQVLNVTRKCGISPSNTAERVLQLCTADLQFTTKPESHPILQYLYFILQSSNIQ